MAKRFLAILFMILLVFSLSAVTVSAANEPSDDVAAEDNTGETAAETGGPESGAGEETAAAEEPTEAATEEPEQAESKSPLFYIIIAAVVVVVIAAAAIIIWRNPKLREKIKKFIRDYRSEMKKIVWPTRTQVIQNTGVVLVAIIFIALIVGALDLLFGFGVGALGDLKTAITK